MKANIDYLRLDCGTFELLRAQLHANSTLLERGVKVTLLDDGHAVMEVDHMGLYARRGLRWRGYALTTRRNLTCAMWESALSRVVAIANFPITEEMVDQVREHHLPNGGLSGLIARLGAWNLRSRFAPTPGDQVLVQCRGALLIPK